MSEAGISNIVKKKSSVLLLLFIIFERKIMQTFNNVINSVNGVIWSTALIVILLAAGIFLCQDKVYPVPPFGEMWKR